jgi:hypothetical protein
LEKDFVDKVIDESVAVVPGVEYEDVVEKGLGHGVLQEVTSQHLWYESLQQSLRDEMKEGDPTEAVLVVEDPVVVFVEEADLEVLVAALRIRVALVRFWVAILRRTGLPSFVWQV